MPLSKEKQREYQSNRRLGITPEIVIPKTEDVIPKCQFKGCIICDPVGYHEWFKRTYGRVDSYNLGRI